MPIRLKESMPVIKKLSQERIFAMTDERANRQDIRPLRIAILNIMPNKENTEMQLLRLLSNSPLQEEVFFIRLATHRYKNASSEYMIKNYYPFYSVVNKHFDGLIITGAPVERLEFEEVDYWEELTEILEWSKTHVTSVMYLSWAAQAGLYYHYGIPKYDLPEKLSGIFEQKVFDNNSELLRGFDDRFYVPHSRYTGISEKEINVSPDLHILAGSEETGAYIISDGGKNIFVTGQPEYDVNTLANEYSRDIAKGISPSIPKNYFPDGDPRKTPVSRWIASSNLLFGNWLNYFVYQITPYNF